MKHPLHRPLAALLACACLMAALLTPVSAAGRASDVPAGHWAEEDIARATALGLLTAPGGVFAPSEPATRADFVTALCRLMGWKMVTPPAGSFTDNQNPAAPYYSAVETALANGAVTLLDDAFRPEDPITREEMAVMLVRALGYGPIAGLSLGLPTPFQDVTANGGYLSMAFRLGLMNGTADGVFNPDRTATRASVAALLVRVYDKLHAAAPAVCGVASSPQDLTLDGVDQVAIPALRLVYSGEVSLAPGLGDEDVSAIRASAGDRAQLLCLSASAKVMQSTPASAAQLIAQAVADGKWDGLLLDGEKLTATQKNAYTALTAALRAALPEGTLLYVAAEAPAWQERSIYNGYDYAALAAQADRIILRPASYQKMVAGFPTAPQEPLEQIYYAVASLDGAIPAEKLSLWLSAGGAVWQGSSNAGAISAGEVAAQLGQPGVKKYWSDRYAAAYFCRTESNIRVVTWHLDAQGALARRQLLSFLGGGGGFCVSELSGSLGGANGLLTGLTAVS